MSKAVPKSPAGQPTAPSSVAPAPTPATPAPATNSNAPAPANEPFWPVRVAGILVFTLACTGVGWTLWSISKHLPPDNLAAIVQAHLPAIIGMPIAALFSVAIVAAARSLGGPFSIQIVGLRAEGATATMLLWLTAFGAIVVAIRALW